MVHVLLTNDDGPLSDEFSPYVKSFVDAIEKYTDWDLTIVVPHTQRSWIGKAHFAGQTLTTTFIYPTNEGNDYKGPFPTSQKDLIKQGYKEWKLVDGTPASCADIGSNYLNDGKEVDLVISGPNFGRNTSAVYITSSGTVGAAMEAANLGRKSIGISFGFESRKTDQVIIDEASKIGIQIIKHLYLNWSNEVDLYTINIPLFQDLKLNETKIKYAPILQNTWTTLFEKINNDTVKNDLEEDIFDNSSIHNKIQFKWKPDFHAVHKSVVASHERGEHNDSVVLHNHEISVTPLKSIFKGVDSIEGEIKLAIEQISYDMESQLSLDDSKQVYLSIDSKTYIYPALIKSLNKHLPKINVKNSIPENFPKDVKIFQFGDYEELNFDEIYINQNYKINSYIYRKALIRKHHLSHTIHSYIVKNPDSILRTAFPETFNLEVDYAEFLDDSLDEAYELRLELEKLEKYWILKPGMSDKGQGIRVFKSIDQLQDIFDSFEEDDTDDEYAEDDNRIITSQLRHFVVQEYISKPLILKEYNGKKFHIRTYVLADGSLSVYVFNRMLTLFSASKYETPNDDEDEISMKGHLTNTCLQEEKEILLKNSVVEFSELNGLSEDDKSKILNQIYDIVKEIFKAGLNIDKMNFQPLNNAFEIYGFDFLIDEDLNVKILEINAFPDFKQTGDDLKSLIFDLFDSIVKQSVVPFFENTPISDDNKLLVNVLKEDTNNW